MAFNFNLNDTEALKAIKREKFPLFKFVGFFENFFLFLLILSACFFAASFFGVTSGYFYAKLIALLFGLYLFFWNLSLFTSLKIKKPPLPLNLADAADNPDNYNLAGFLGFSTAKIVNESIKFCRRKKLPVNSASLFYSAVQESIEISLIVFRLGLDVKNLQEGLRNYLEKMQKQQEEQVFAQDFQNTLMEALKFAKERGHSVIGEKEILVGLAKSDEFFKKFLVEHDLKEPDVENLAIWLDSAEDLAEKTKQFWSKENLARAGSLGKDWASGYTIT
ncbi:MAG: hypothetical protein NT026_02325, partial [Candidatus Staskawiczbacteria bacterium]|nr:hypothetical protein [Candidatus Staskawiczbacteria bacterium]